MDVKTLATNLENQCIQLNILAANISNLASSIAVESGKSEYNIDVIKSFVASADIQMTALDSQKIVVQGILDALSGSSKKSSKSSS